jgi:hypothetical protein
MICIFVVLSLVAVGEVQADPVRRFLDSLQLPQSVFCNFCDGTERA